MFESTDALNRVTQALLRDARTEGSMIDVSEQGGVVVLSGTAPSPVARQAAEEIALQQPGVMAVINDLSVSHSGDSEDDDSLVSRLR